MTKPKRLSQSAIAKATGLSRATVSLVLRGGTGPSEATQTKVLTAAKRLGYQPNELVHSIRSGKSRTVGVLAEPHDSYWRDVCYGIHDRLIESNHLPLFLWHNHQTVSAEYARQQIHRLLSRWVDGVILWPFFADIYAKHLHEFQTRNIPLVIIDHTIPETEADVIESDESQIAEQLVAHLQSLNHRNYLVVSGPEHIGWADKRAQSIKAELEKHAGVAAHVLRVPQPSTIPSESKELADVSRMIAATLEQNPRITAVIACTDIIARSVYSAAGELNWSIPGRLSVVGVADLNFAELMSPPLTTVRQNGYAIGRQAAQVELERGAGLLTGASRRFQVGTTLVERQSTGPAAATG